MNIYLFVRKSVRWGGGLKLIFIRGNQGIAINVIWWHLSQISILVSHKNGAIELSPLMRIQW